MTIWPRDPAQSREKYPWTCTLTGDRVSGKTFTWLENHLADPDWIYDYVYLPQDIYRASLISFAFARREDYVKFCLVWS